MTTCPKCGYSLAGIESAVCPECGIDTESLPRLTIAQSTLKRRIDRWNKIGIAICIGSAAAQILVPIVFGTSFRLADHIMLVVIITVGMCFFLLPALVFKRKYRPFQASFCLFAVLVASFFYWIPVALALLYMRVASGGLIIVHVYGMPAVWLIMLLAWPLWMYELVRGRLIENREFWWSIAIFALLSAGATLLSFIGALIAGGYAVTN